MAELQDLLIRIDATTEQLRRELRRAEEQTDRSMGRIDQHSQRAGKSFDAMATRAKAAAAAIAIMAAAAGRSLGGKMIEVGRSTDILNAQLITATGSTEQAGIAFQALEQIAAETPYSLDQVVTAFVKLKNLGLEPSRAAIMSYGNTAAAMGKSLDQMIEAVADAATGEFERLKEFGIKASKQGDEVSFTFQGVTTTVRNSAEEITAYLRQIGDVDFAGAMTLRAESLDGALSNLSDSWDALFRTIHQGPIGAAIENQVRLGSMALQRLADMVARLQGTASREQLVRGQLDDLFMRRQELEERVNMRRRGAVPQSLLDELEGVKGEIQTLLAEQNELRAASADNLARAANGGADPRLKPVVVTAQRLPADYWKAPKAGRSAREPAAPRPEFDAASIAALDAEAKLLDAQNRAFDEARRFWSSTRTEAEQIEAQIARVKELSAGGFFAQSGIDDQQILARLQEQLDALGAQVEEETNYMNEFAKAAAQSMQQSFADFLFDPFDNGLDGMLSGLANTLRRMTAEIAAQAALNALFTAMSGSGVGWISSMGSAFAGARAAGGPVSANRAYLVGERGPELFVPGVSGAIQPNVGGGSGVDVQIIDQRGASSPPVDVRQSMVNGRQMISVMVREEMAGAFADGSIDKMFRGASIPVRRTGRR